MRRLEVSPTRPTAERRRLPTHQRNSPNSSSGISAPSPPAIPTRLRRWRSSWPAQSARRASRQDHAVIVAGEERVGGEEAHAFAARLGDAQAVERVAIKRGQGLDGAGVPGRDVEEVEARLAKRGERRRRRGRRRVASFEKRIFDRDLPKAQRRYGDLVRAVANERARPFAEPRVGGDGPDRASACREAASCRAQDYRPEEHFRDLRVDGVELLLGIGRELALEQAESPLRPRRRRER